MGSEWEWEVPVGLDDLSRRIPEAGKHTLVVLLYGPGYMYNRRFSAIPGDAIQFHIEPFRSISTPIGNERGSSSMSIEDSSGDMPILSRPIAFPSGMGGSRTGSPIEEENRTCDRVPSDGEFFSLDSMANEEWFEELLKHIN